MLYERLLDSITAIRLGCAIAAGQSAGMISRLLGRGGGTTLPGVVAQRLAPDALQRLSARLLHGVALVCGTNGKTTTTRMLAAILADSGLRLVHNRAGANLVSGLTSTIVKQSRLDGTVQADMGLFETDEAALPQAMAETAPRLVLLHNLFRDQLDRYGEIDTLAGNWRTALQRLAPESSVLLNADDPSIAGLGSAAPGRVRSYGLEDTRHAVGAAAHIADSQFCRICGARYAYSAAFYAHIGHYACPNCGACRPTPDYRLERLELDGTQGSRLQIVYPGGAMELHLPIPGLYNALNALAAVAAALELGIAPTRIRDTLEQFSAAFGRIERVNAAGRPLMLVLIKNPVGASEAVRMLVGQTPARPLHLLIAINDRFADGTDVSWLWDAEFERLAGNVATAVVSGTRADDMAVRLKYAGVATEAIFVYPESADALDAALHNLPNGETLYILPTYTAMLDLRSELTRRGWTRPFWED